MDENREEKEEEKEEERGEKARTRRVEWTRKEKRRLRGRGGGATNIREQKENRRVDRLNKNKYSEQRRTEQEHKKE